MGGRGAAAFEAAIDTGSSNATRVVLNETILRQMRSVRCEWDALLDVALNPCGRRVLFMGFAVSVVVRTKCVDELLIQLLFLL